MEGTKVSPLELANAARAAALPMSAEELIQEAKLDVSTAAESMIRDRALEMPFSCLRTYLRAMKGRSPRAAIKANCAMCMGWDDWRNGVRNCTDPACPLYEYRPYQE